MFSSPETWRACHQRDFHSIHHRRPGPPRPLLQLAGLRNHLRSDRKGTTKRQRGESLALAVIDQPVLVVPTNVISKCSLRYRYGIFSNAIVMNFKTTEAAQQGAKLVVDTARDLEKQEGREWVKQNVSLACMMAYEVVHSDELGIYGIAATGGMAFLRRERPGQFCTGVPGCAGSECACGLHLTMGRVFADTAWRLSLP